MLRVERIALAGGEAWYLEKMRSMLAIHEVLLHDGATALYVQSAQLGALTVPLSEVDAFCAALQAKAQAVREEAAVRAERGLREEAPAEE